MSKEIAVIKDLELVPFFTKGDSVDEVLERIAKEARALVPDVSTDKGRKAIKANVTKVTSSKTYLEAEGKELAAEYKAIPKLIDSNRKKVKDFLNDLQDEIRKPLTDWEEERKAINLESERVKAEQDRIAAIDADFDFAVLLMEADFKERAEKAEAERLAKIEHEKEIARKAAEQARIDEQERQKAEQERIQREKVEAQQREEAAAREAQQAKLREQQAIEQARIDAENAEIQRKEDARLAEERRLADIEAAKQAEIERRKAEQAEAKRIADEKAANVENQRRVNNEMLSDFIAAGLGESDAKLAATALAKKQVRNAQVNY